MGKTERKKKKITQLKWPKYQKPKDENMGWTKQKLKHHNSIVFADMVFNINLGFTGLVNKDATDSRGKNPFIFLI